MKKIIGINIKDREKSAISLQNVLTEFGCNIKTRLGLHEAGNICSPHGIILLELVGDEPDWQSFEEKLKSIDGLSVKTMEFN